MALSPMITYILFYFWKIEEEKMLTMEVGRVAGVGILGDVQGGSL